ncbi:MAG: hypothetical protein ACOX2L_11595 [Anaerolineae bacterium]|jgi:hypothetical protein|nr:hypothetical protein [Chloroflexota bacterium]
MNSFPSVEIGGVALPRVICGTNALLGWSHVSAGRDAWIRQYYTAERIAEVWARCQELGVNAVMGPLFPRLIDALEATERLTGLRPMWVATSNATQGPRGHAAEWEAARAAGRREEARALVRESLAEQARELWQAQASFCLLHGDTTDSWPVVEGRASGLDEALAAIRAAGLVPGAMTHDTARLRLLDAGHHDLALFGTPVNRAGWMMLPDRDAALTAIGAAQRPVLAIKTLACGRLDEGQLSNWLEWAVAVPGVATIAIGVGSAEEAAESIPILRRAWEAVRTPVNV